MRILVFFFSSRRRHTRWPRDWSSDVCSSDLYRPWRGVDRDTRHQSYPPDRLRLVSRAGRGHRPALLRLKIGRASCRERVEITEVPVVLENREDGEQIKRQLDR